MRVQKLRDLREAGAGAIGGPSGGGERELLAGARRDRVRREVRRGRREQRHTHGRRFGRSRRLVRSVRPAARRQAGPIPWHVDVQRQAAGRRDSTVDAEADPGRGRRVRPIRYVVVIITVVYVFPVIKLKSVMNFSPFLSLFC